MTEMMPGNSNPAQNRRIDLSLTRPILALTLPVAASGHLENLVGIADIFMVGKLGPAAISAVGIANQISMVFGIMMVAVTTGTLAIVAQTIGAGNKLGASAAAKQSFSLVALLSVGLGLIGLAGTTLFLESLSVKPEVVHLAVPYLRVYFGGILLSMLNYSVAVCLQAAGDTRTPMYLSMLINAIKLFASYLLIFGIWGLPKMGVTGAALGSVVGLLFGVTAGFWALFSGRFGLTLLPGTSFKLELALASRLLKVGIPSALQGLFRNGSSVIFVKFVALTSHSTTAVAAYTIGNQMERILRRSSLAFGTAATALCGHSLGAKRTVEADQRGWTTMFVGTLAIVGLGTIIYNAAQPIMALFTNAEDGIHIGIYYLYAIAIAEPFMCAAIISGGALRGAGDTMPPLYYTIVSQWLIRLPTAYLLAFTLGYDILGVWVALVIFSALQGVLTVRKFAAGDWKKRTI